MDANTLLVVVLNGGLVIFFVYALYYIRSPVKPVKELQKSKKIVSPIFDSSSQSRITKDEFIFRALAEPDKSPLPAEIESEPEEVPSPPEYVFPEYEPEPEEVPSPPEYVFPEYEPEPEEVPSPPEYEFEQSQIQDQVDKPLKLKTQDK